jgi:hypothetical protein
MIGETMLWLFLRKHSGPFNTLSDPLAKRRGGTVSTDSSKSQDSGAWRELYAAVLFEVDKTKLPERIAQAEKAFALRARE